MNTLFFLIIFLLTDVEDSLSIQNSFFEPDSELTEILSNTGRNSDIILRTLSTLDSSYISDAIWLIKSLPHLDRLEIDSISIVDNIIYSIKSKKFSPLPESLFLNYILNYRVENENFSNYKQVLWDYFYNIFDDNNDIYSKLSYLNYWIRDSIVETERELFGSIKSVNNIFLSRRGTYKEKVILTVAILKTFGIPSRFVYIPVGLNPAGLNPDGLKSSRYFYWLEVWIDDKWIPFYNQYPELLGDFNLPDDSVGISLVFSRDEGIITDKYIDIGILDLKIEKAPEDYDYFSISIFANAFFKPLDELGTCLDSNSTFFTELGPGNYYLIMGNRNKDGNTNVNIIPFEIFANDTTFLNVIYPDEIPSLNADSNISDIPIFLNFTQKTIIFYGDNNESSIRMWNILDEINKDIDIINYETLLDNTAADSFQSLIKLYNLPKPVVLGIDTDGQTTFSNYGYNLNIKNIILSWLNED